MNDFLELCRIRHSLRRFADRPVEKEKILRCLEAARLAPSATNSQAWRFLVFDDPKKKQEVCDAAFSGVMSGSRPFAHAPVIIVLLITGRLIMNLFSRVQGIDYRLVDAGIAGEHLALAAAEQGLGTCWIGMFLPRALMKNLGTRAKGHTPVAMFALGYPPEGHKPPAKKRRPIEEITGWNRLP